MRAVVFTDVPGRTTRELIEATLAEAETRSGLEVCGFVTANPAEMFRSRSQRASRRARAFAVAATGGPRSLGPAVNLRRIAQQADLPILVAETGVNDPAFLDRLHEELAPELLLSYFCTQILRAALLASMEHAVNYHDGLLPSYGGLAATAQSVYHGETESGFTFHHITTGIDDGPILAQSSVPVRAGDTGAEVARVKVAAAARAVPGVLDKIAANDPGRPQHGTKSYFSRSDMDVLTSIEDPSTISAEELHRRLRAFGMVHVVINGAEESVTQIGPASEKSAFAFTTCDGAQLRATRIAGLPAWTTAVRRRFRGLGRPNRQDL